MIYLFYGTLCGKERANADETCEKYEEILAAVSGIDLQLLGPGHNGHIGFNEPSDVFFVCTHCVVPTRSAIRANACFFLVREGRSRAGIYYGYREHYGRGKILLVVIGADKSAIVKRGFSEI